MKMKQILLAAALSVPAVAWSAQCDEDLRKANAGLAAGPKPTVTAENFEQARSLVGEATALLAKGDDMGCVFTVIRALELMDMAESE